MSEAQQQSGMLSRGLGASRDPLKTFLGFVSDVLRDLREVTEFLGASLFPAMKQD